MLIMKLLFAALIVICAVFYVMYLWDFALVLLVAMISVPVIMFVITLITKHMIDVDFVLKSDSISKNESFPIQLRVTNRCIFPIGKAEATVEYWNICSNDVSSFDLLMPIQARNSQNISFQLKSRFCGMLNVRCAGITLYDPLKIFKFRIGHNISTSVAVLPEGHEISGQVSFSDRINEESSMFSEYKPGDDPSEVFDLRGYNPGDKLNRIHWKLSSKKDEFIVKDYSLPVDVPCTVFLDLHCVNRKKDVLLPVFDTLIETFVSVSQFLIENERVHVASYYSFSLGQFVERRVTDFDSLAAVTRELLLSFGVLSSCPKADCFFAEKEDLSMSSFVFVTPEADSLVLEFIDQNIDADLKTAFMIAESPEEAAAVSDMALTDINKVPVIIGRITSSIKDIVI